MDNPFMNSTTETFTPGDIVTVVAHAGKSYSRTISGTISRVIGGIVDINDRGHLYQFRAIDLTRMQSNPFMATNPFMS